jgi:hypothetical protein
MAKGNRQKDKQYNGQRKSKKRTNNIMAKGKRERTNNIMAKRKKQQKDKQYNGQRKSTKGQTV